MSRRELPAVVTALRHSNARGTARLVLAAIASYAYPDGTGAWPSLATIAKVAAGWDGPSFEEGVGRISERTVQRAIKQLESAGELRVHYKAGAHGCNAYEIALCDEDGGSQVSRYPDSQVSPSPDTQVSRFAFKEQLTPTFVDSTATELCPPTPTSAAPHPDTALSPEPSLEPSESQPIKPSRIDFEFGSEGKAGSEDARLTVEDWLLRLDCGTEQEEASALVEEFGEDEVAWALGVASDFSNGPGAITAARVYLECTPRGQHVALREAEKAAAHAEAPA